MTVLSCLERIAAFKPHRDADAWKEFCNDLAISELAGTTEEFAVLWEELVAVQKGVKTFSEHVATRKAIRHVIDEKMRVAPVSPEVAPGLRPVRFVRR